MTAVSDRPDMPTRAVSGPSDADTAPVRPRLGALTDAELHAARIDLARPFGAGR